MPNELYKRDNFPIRRCCISIVSTRQYIRNKKHDHNYPKFRINVLFLQHHSNRWNKCVDRNHLHFLYDEFVSIDLMNEAMLNENDDCCYNDHSVISNPPLNFDYVNVKLANVVNQVTEFDLNYPVDVFARWTMIFSRLRRPLPNGIVVSDQAKSNVPNSSSIVDIQMIFRI